MAMEVVTGLDLQRYMGKWYEIATSTPRFQPKASINTAAIYALAGDGVTVKVLNQTFTDNGKKKKVTIAYKTDPSSDEAKFKNRKKKASIEGTAYKTDPSSDEAKFKVRFMVPPFLPIVPVTGDYWVLFVDPDYHHALVGEPSKTSLWILCRESQLDEETYIQLVQRAKDEGYEVEKLQKTPHTPEEDDAPVDKVGLWWIRSVFGK